MDKELIGWMQTELWFYVQVEAGDACVLGLMLFNIQTNSIDSASSTSSAGLQMTSLLSGAVDATEGWDGIQTDLDKLARWAYKNPKRFNKPRCRCFIWVEAIPDVNTEWEKKTLRAVLWRRTLEFLMKS